MSCGDLHVRSIALLVTLMAASEDAAARGPDAMCRTRVKSLRSWMETVVPSFEEYHPSVGIRLVERPETPPQDRGAVYFDLVSPRAGHSHSEHAVFFLSTEVAKAAQPRHLDLAKVAEQVSLQEIHREVIGLPPSRRAIVGIDSEAQWSLVARVVGALSSAGARHIGFAFLIPETRWRQVSSDRIAALHGGENPFGDPLLAPCAGLKDALLESSSVPAFMAFANGLHDKFKHRVVSQLLACNCGVPESALRTVIAAKFYGERKRYGVQWLSVNQRGTVVSFPGSAQWQNTHRDLLRRGMRSAVWLGATE